MDSEAEATIAWSYYKFQNGLMIMPKFIPYGDKSIYEYIKPPKMRKSFIKLKEEVLKKIAEKGYDASYANRIHPESFKKYVDFCNEYKEDKYCKYDPFSDNTSFSCGCADYGNRGFNNFHSCDKPKK